MTSLCSYIHSPICAAGRVLAVGMGLLGLAVPVAGQSVSPPLAEYQERARSSFQLHNGSLFPLTVVLEVRGFRVTEEGEVVDEALDTSRIHVKLSAMSFRIAARGSYRVFYEATGDSLPAWFNILSAMTGAKTESGLNVRLLLPHVVYLNQKRPLQKDEVVIRALKFDPRSRKARIQLENLGPHLGRVLQVNVTDGHATSQPSGGFPLFPRSRRWTEVPWEDATPPSRLTVRFARFSIDTALATP
ncbi:MAG: hypothetical protein ABI703_04145 [Gemmatimonadales bacterium]